MTSSCATQSLVELHSIICEASNSEIRKWFVNFIHGYPAYRNRLLRYGRCVCRARDRSMAPLSTGVHGPFFSLWISWMVSPTILEKYTQFLLRISLQSPPGGKIRSWSWYRTSHCGRDRSEYWSLSWKYVTFPRTPSQNRDVCIRASDVPLILDNIGPSMVSARLWKYPSFKRSLPAFDLDRYRGAGLSICTLDSSNLAIRRDKFTLRTYRESIALKAGLRQVGYLQKDSSPRLHKQRNTVTSITIATLFMREFKRILIYTVSDEICSFNDGSGLLSCLPNGLGDPVWVLWAMKRQVEGQTVQDKVFHKQP